MNLDKLNKVPQISELVPLTYSMLVNNIDIHKQKKVKSEYSFLNLEKLAIEFPLDIKLNQNVPNYTPPAFISKSYYQSNPEFAYNYPPKGPIEKHFECMFCNQVGPDYHLETCPRPFTSSLYLTAEGTKHYTDYEEGTSYSNVTRKGIRYY